MFKTMLATLLLSPIVFALTPAEGQKLVEDTFQNSYFGAAFYFWCISHCLLIYMVIEYLSC